MKSEVPAEGNTQILIDILVEGKCHQVLIKVFVDYHQNFCQKQDQRYSNSTLLLFEGIMRALKGKKL